MEALKQITTLFPQKRPPKKSIVQFRGWKQVETKKKVLSILLPNLAEKLQKQKKDHQHFLPQKVESKCWYKKMAVTMVAKSSKKW